MVASGRGFPERGPSPSRRAFAPRPAGRPPDRAEVRDDQAILVLHDVTKTYPNGKTALRDVDLVIPEGDFVFLVGPRAPASRP